MKKYHLISGLPRSGTTLLSTILKQNPRFESSISGPLARFVRSIITESSSQGGYRFECPPEKRKKLIAGLFDNYYDDPTKEVAFNVNRQWGLLLHVIKDLYPNSKMLMCVRDLASILNSFETLQRKNPYEFTSMFSPEENTSVYSRCETLLRQDRTIGFAMVSAQQALVSEHKKSIMVIEYEYLVKNPEQMLKAIYKFIDEPYFEHDFQNTESSYELFDSDVQLSGLHSTRKIVDFKPPEMILPPDIIGRVKGMEFWR